MNTSEPAAASGGALTPTRRAVVIVINALHSGGAEKTCIQVARSLHERFDVEVVSLLTDGPAADELRALGIRVSVLNATTFARQIAACWRLGSKLRRRRPEAVLTFLYLADLLGGVLARLLLRQAKIYWNVRNNVLSPRQSSKITYVVSRLNSFLSRRVPDTVVFCSALARAQHKEIGYRARREDVVENSAAAVPFTFSADKRRAFRAGRFDDDEFLFLFVARFDPVKRVDLYIDACAAAYRRFGGKPRFVIAGRGMEGTNAALQHALAATGVRERFELLGHVTDQQLLYSSADCVIVTSETEGSPNVIYEAIATRLQSLVLASIGTEDVRGWGVHRLPSRDTERLVEAMGKLMQNGILPAAARQTVAAPVPAPLHPLAQYYLDALR